MSSGLLQALGGVGLFLLGMVVMTDGLRALAGDALRRALAHFTHSPLSGAVTGAATTAVIQSSSATTVAAVGFAGAGLLTFSQALGILFGANIGTTLTGWMVALLGFKLKIGSAALALVLVGVLLRLFGRGRAAPTGFALAGFGLVFVGIAALQRGMAGLEGVVTPAVLPPDTWGGRALLVVIGAGVTLVTQSSSAGVAAALAAVNAGTISFPQAAAMVIGMDVGTTVTAAVAAVGGSLPARRTGYAHVIYNLFTGAGAFLLLPLYVSAAGGLTEGDPEIALVAFHTLFNTLGVIAVLPVADRFADLVVRLVPGQVSPFAQRLDARLLAAPGSALDAVGATVRELAAKALVELTRLLTGVETADRLRDRLALLSLALVETRHYVERLHTSADLGPVYARHVSVMHAIDHLDRLVDRCGEADRARTARDDPRLRAVAAHVAGATQRLDASLAADVAPLPDDAARELWEGLEARKKPYRREVLEHAAAGGLDSDAALARLDAMRWLERCSYHVWRIVHHLHRVQLEPAAEPVVEERPPHAEPEAPE